MKRISIGIATLAVAVGLASPSLAQPEETVVVDPPPAEGQSEFGVMPMASQGSDKRLERRLARQSTPKHDRRNKGPGAVLAIHGGVPIFVGDGIDRDVFRPGGSFAFSAGVDLGHLVPEIEVGFTGVPIKATNGDRDPLKRVHVGLGGRLQFPNASLVLPYLGASFALQWWKTSAGLAGFVGNSFRFAPGVSVRAGAAISLGGSVGLDIGLRYNASFKGNNALPQTRHWIEPSFGIRIWL